MKKKALAVIHSSDFRSDDMRRVAEVVGVEAAFALIREFSGSQVYFPVLTDSGAVEAFVAEHKGTMPVKQIARELEVSVRSVYRAMNKPRKRRVDPLQTSLIDSGLNPV